MAYTLMNSQLGGPKIGSVDKDDYTPAWKLGDIVRAVDPTYGVGEFIYLKGVASTARGSVVVYNQDDNSTKLAVANDIGPIAVAMAASVADTYGWYQISGKGVAPNHPSIGRYRPQTRTRATVSPYSVSPTGSKPARRKKASGPPTPGS